MIPKITKKNNLILNGIILLAILLFKVIVFDDYISSPVATATFNLIVISISISILFILNSYLWYCSKYPVGVILPIILIIIIWVSYLQQAMTTTDPMSYGLSKIVIGLYGTIIYLTNIVVYLILKPKN